MAAVRRADQKTAADAFRAGDTAAGLAYIEKHVKTGVKAPNKELQVARSLSSVACILANERSYQRSREVALIALNKLSSEKRVAMKSAENLSALRLSAEIYDIILNDTSAAIRAYKAVLAANEKDKRAAQRVAFLESRNAVILARAKEIEAAKIKR